MNKFAIILFLSLASLILGGCATSPVDYQKRSKASTATTLAVATGAGAAIGQQIDSTYGAPAGAVVGLAAGYVVDKVASGNAERIRAEAIEQGRREERLKVMQKYWQEKTLALEKQKSDGALTATPAPVQYEAGIYEGVRMLPHTDNPESAAQNGEPQR